jgi:hypothetical protein
MKLFIVIEMWQGLLNDAIPFTDEEKAKAHLQEYKDENLDPRCVEEFGEEETMNDSDINGSCIHEAELNLDGALNLKQVAHRIIDLVEAKICYDNPQVDLLRGQHKGNTLLYGEGYYELEDEVVAVLKELTGNG